jgi:Na+/melibiose symporter-like transporter
MKKLLIFLAAILSTIASFGQDSTHAKATFKETFMVNFLGGIEPGYFVAATVFSLLGVILMVLWSAANRNPLSPNSPVEFSFKYLVADGKNWFRFFRSILIAIIVLFLTLRFTNEFLGKELNMFYAFLVGAGLDRLVLYIISLVRQKIPTATLPQSPGN